MRQEREERDKDGISVVVISIPDLGEEGKKRDIEEKVIEPLRNAEPVSNISSRNAGEDLKEEIRELVENNGPDVIFTIGGTDIRSKDNRIEILREIFEKEIPGFGELLRFQASRSLGASKITDRSTAGKINRKLIFCLPDDPEVAGIGVDLLKKDLGKMMNHARR